LSLSIYEWLGGHQDLVVNNNGALKLLKKNLQFTSQVIQIKPCGHHGRFFNIKKEFGGCQSNEIQFINIKHTWLDWTQTEPRGIMAAKPITRGKKATT
jgi:hypothetical protein